MSDKQPENSVKVVPTPETTKSSEEVKKTEEKKTNESSTATK